MSLRVVCNEDGASLTRAIVTPEQRRVYEKAHRIFGNRGACRPDAPGRPVRGLDNLAKARMSNTMHRFAKQMVDQLAPEYRDRFLEMNGLDPNAYPLNHEHSPLRLVQPND